MSPRRFLLTVLAVLFACGLSLWSYPWLLDSAARWLVVEDRLEKADIIVVISGDENGERVAEAVRLYREGWAPRLLLSGGPLAWRLTGAEWMKKQAVESGIPARVMIMEDRSRSTIENARFTLPLLQAQGIRRAIIVTSPQHTRRTKRVFRRVFRSSGIELLVRPVRESELVIPGWWTRHEDTQLVLWEFGSLLLYRTKGY